MPQIDTQAGTSASLPYSTELTAVDISSALLGVARTRVSDGRVSFVRQNVERIDRRDVGDGFEAAYGCSVLHHLDLDDALPRLRALLVPGADLVFSEPNLLNPQVRLIFSGLAWARRRWAVSETEMAFYPWELRSIFTRHGFEVIDLFTYDFMHPAISARALRFACAVNRTLERTPLVRLLGGSCFVHARVPGAGS